MSAPSHAPAPWKYHLNVGPTKALIVEADGSTIVEVRNNVHDSRFEANVRVMVAAPQLLAVAKMFEVRGQGLTSDEWRKVRDAIAYAEGRS